MEILWKKRQSEILNAIAMKRIGKPEEIANAVMFFSSEQSGFITGQTLAVTGVSIIFMYSIAIDIGGTFTDIIISDGKDNFSIAKVPSTPV